MVLPNGTYLPVVDSNTNSDLFWGNFVFSFHPAHLYADVRCSPAIRGGGSNFGVVLQWTLKLYPQAPLVHGCGAYSMAITCHDHTHDVVQRLSFPVPDELDYGYCCGNE